MDGEDGLTSPGVKTAATVTLGLAPAAGAQTAVALRGRAGLQLRLFKASPPKGSRLCNCLNGCASFLGGEGEGMV